MAIWQSDNIFLRPNDDADWHIVLDSIPDGLLKVRQLATIADAVNANRRVYPKAVMQKALDEARQRIAAGATLMEYVHPEVAVLSGGRQEYIDNPDRKSARIDEVSDVGRDGKVYISYTVLDTEAGREVAESFRNRRPMGVSTRFKMTGHAASVDGENVEVADAMYISTWDHVPDPAVPQTKHDFTLLTDSQLAQIQNTPSQEEGPFPTGTGPSSRSGADAQRVKEKARTMNEEIKRALNRLFARAAANAPVEELRVLRQIASDAIVAAADKGEEVVEASLQLLKADDVMQSIAGYNADKPAPMPVLGNATGTGAGQNAFAGDLESNAKNAPVGQPAEETAGDREDREFLRKMRERETQAQADAERHAAIDAEIEKARTNVAGLAAEHQDFVLDTVRQMATDAASVPSLVEKQVEVVSKMLSDAALAARGFAGAAQGVTTEDPAQRSGPHLTTRDRGPVWMAEVDKILEATDEHRRRTMNFNPEAVRKLRAENRKKIQPWLDEIAMRHHNAADAASWFARDDALMTGGEKAFVDNVAAPAAARYDTITLSNMFNQPTITTALLLQSFQDLEALQWVDGIGPGLEKSGIGGWSPTNGGADGRVGSVLRIPVEYVDYAGMSGYAAAPTPQYDPGLLSPEMGGIDELSLRTQWVAFAPLWRRIAATMSRDVVKAIGNGPLNYPLVARALFHMTYDKARRLDKAMLDEMLQISDEYGAIAVTSEAPTLPNNSKWGGGGQVTINLNPTKTANAAVVAGDPAITYGSTGGNVAGALRLQTAGLGNAAPYVGTVNGASPIVRPRTKYDLAQNGSLTSSIQNGVTVAITGTGAAAVLGVLDVNGNVINAAGQAGANCAIDWLNGVFVFTAGFTGYSNNAGAVQFTAGTTGVTFSYSYVTNFDNFQVNNVTLANGVLMEQYLNGLARQFDISAAKMGSYPRYVKPDLALMSLNAANWLLSATIFYKLNSPEKTNLYPTENYFAERNGIPCARLNAPWYVGDTRILLTKQGSTKYALDTPTEVRGPFPKYDQATGKIVPAEVYYCEENSVICTPQVVDQNNNILNPVARTVILR